MCPSRSADDAVDLEQPVLLDDHRPVLGIDPTKVEALVEPFDDWYLIRLDPPIRSSKGGILVGDKSVPESRLGVIVKRGPGFLMPDGSSRAAMNAKEGDRVLFERRAGKTLPRVPDETDARRGTYGYLLIRDGSIQAKIGPGIRRRRAERGDKIEVFDIPPEEVHPCADWTFVATDAPPVQTDPAEKARKNGIAGPRFLLPESVRARETEKTDFWSGTVKAQGPGRLADTDGQTRAAPRSRVGDRVMFMRHALNQTVPTIEGYVLVLEREVVSARIGA
jgi:co-chaperonin GroES (HSP10)